MDFELPIPAYVHILICIHTATICLTSSFLLTRSTFPEKTSQHIKTNRNQFAKPWPILAKNIKMPESMLGVAISPIFTCHFHHGRSSCQVRLRSFEASRVATPEPRHPTHLGHLG